MEKPDFVVIGAPKCGTTSLHNYLRQNPKIFLTEQKELHYFSAEMRLLHMAGPGDKKALSTVVRTAEEYAAFFAECKAWQVAGDISPSYLIFGKRCAEKIRELVPNAKIIVLLRNPIEKTYSQYMHQVQRGAETLCLKKALAAEMHRQEHGWRDMWMYAGSTFYFQNLHAYFEVFGTENVHVVFFEEFIHNKKRTLDDICRFIGVEPCEWDVSRHLNKSELPKSRLIQQFIMKPPEFMKPIKYFAGRGVVSKMKELLKGYNTKPKPELEPEIRTQLKTLFANDVCKLEDLLGRQVPWNEFYE